MTKRASVSRQLSLSLRLQRLSADVEALLPEVKSTLAQNGALRPLLLDATRSLERASKAMSAVVTNETTSPARGLGSLLEGTAPLLSILGSRVVLATAGGERRSPSTGAQTLAILMGEPDRSFDAAEVAERLAVSVPVARTTLNRLVQSGHARRRAAGRFQSKS